jgi:L-seryl-tRNA(Ser) seleniumtransferase
MAQTESSTRDTKHNTAELFRRLPSVDEVLRCPELASLAATAGHTAVTDAARTAIADLRRNIAAGALNEDALDAAIAKLPRVVEQQLQTALRYSLRPVINATGVILHTNLGRAPLPQSALEHICETSGIYSNLEFDIESGGRGKRDVHADRLFSRLLNFPELANDVASIVINNNAAAVLLALNTLAEGGEAIVSRGELVEIGGSFRIPDVMEKSGATLHEVGTTNRTRIADYERAINERTKLLLRVHRSNFQIVGFTEQPSLEELAALGRKHGIPVMEDLGSGALFDLREVGITGEPDVARSLRAGIDVVTYSGDKLLGGPQAGILSGRPDLIATIRKNPLFRALRVDKLTYAALEATLLAYLRQDYDAIPALRMMRVPVKDIAERAAAVCDNLPARFCSELIEGQSVLGGGAAPGATLPTRLVAISCKGLSAEELAACLRMAEIPVVARVEEGKVLLDLRTVFPEQDALVIETLIRIGA